MHVIVLIYFFLGILVFILSIYPIGNPFSKLIIDIFKVPEAFNEFMKWFWLYPIIIAVIVLNIMSL